MECVRETREGYGNLKRWLDVSEAVGVGLLVYGLLVWWLRDLKSLICNYILEKCPVLLANG